MIPHTLPAHVSRFANQVGVTRNQQRIIFDNADMLADYLGETGANTVAHPEGAGGTHFTTLIYHDIDLVEKHPHNGHVWQSVSLAQTRLGGLTAKFAITSNTSPRIFMESMPSLKYVLEGATGETANVLLHQFFTLTIKSIQRGVLNWDPKIENYGVNKRGLTKLLDIGGLRLIKDSLSEADTDESDVAFFFLQLGNSVPSALKPTFHRLAKQYGFDHGGNIFKTMEANQGKSRPRSVYWNPIIVHSKFET